MSSPIPIVSPAPSDPGVLDPVLGVVDGLVPAPLLPVLALAATLGGVAAPSLLRMYRRLTRRDILLQDQRRRTLDFFRERPGATVAEASAALGVDYKTTLHHIRVLEDFDLVHVRKDGRLRRYTASPSAPAPRAARDGGVK